LAAVPVGEALDVVGKGLFDVGGSGGVFLGQGFEALGKFAGQLEAGGEVMGLGVDGPQGQATRDAQVGRQGLGNLDGLVVATAGLAGRGIDQHQVIARPGGGLLKSKLELQGEVDVGAAGLGKA